MSTVSMVKKFEQRSLTTNEHGAPDIDAILQMEQKIKKLKQNGHHNNQSHQSTSRYSG